MSSWSASELIAYLDRVMPVLDRLSHFDLLDITPDTDGQGVREAFYRKAATLHPDLYRLRISASDHERLTTIYARIAEAYLVLRNSRTRAAYQRSQPASPASSPDSQGGQTDGASEAMLSPRARRLYQRAQTAMRLGDHASAILNLKLAIAAAPKSALLRQALDHADALRRRSGDA